MSLIDLEFLETILIFSCCIFLSNGGSNMVCIEFCQLEGVQNPSRSCSIVSLGNCSGVFLLVLSRERTRNGAKRVSGSLAALDSR